MNHLPSEDPYLDLPGLTAVLHSLIRYPRGRLNHPAPAASLHNEGCTHLSRLLAQFPPPPEPALRTLLLKRILPTLALYRALCDREIPSEVALQALETAFLQVYFGRLRQGIAWFNRLPIDPFPLFRPALRQMSRSPYHPEAQQVVADTPACFAVTITRCYPLDILGELGAPELTALFCTSDDWLSAALPKIHWRRTQTLARGGAMCDFRWERE